MSVVTRGPEQHSFKTKQETQDSNTAWLEWKRKTTQHLRIERVENMTALWCRGKQACCSSLMSSLSDLCSITWPQMTFLFHSLICFFTSGHLWCFPETIYIRVALGHRGSLSENPTIAHFRIKSRFFNYKGCGAENNKFRMTSHSLGRNQTDHCIFRFTLRITFALLAAWYNSFFLLSSTPFLI